MPKIGFLTHSKPPFHYVYAPIKELGNKVYIYSFQKQDTDVKCDKYEIVNKDNVVYKILSDDIDIICIPGADLKLFKYKKELALHGIPAYHFQNAYNQRYLHIDSENRADSEFLKWPSRKLDNKELEDLTVWIDENYDRSGIESQPIIGVFGQGLTDEVVYKYSFLKSLNDLIEMCLRIKKIFPNLYFSKHPKTDISVPENLIYGTSEELLKKCSIVVTINSSIGFKGLIYGKRVITCGRSGYSKPGAATMVESERELIFFIKKLFNIEMNQKVIDNINSLIYDYIFKFCINRKDLKQELYDKWLKNAATPA